MKIKSPKPQNLKKPRSSKFTALSVCFFCFCCLLAPTWSSPSVQGEPQSGLPRVLLQAGLYQIDAQVASTDNQREVGLMYRPQMPQQEGMLFVFEQSSPQCFWMKNTILPLSAAFIESDGTIVNIEDMKPQTTDSHCSKKPVRYVLEMNQGWFTKKGLKAGSKLLGAPFGNK